MTGDLDAHTIAALGAAPVDSYGVGANVVTGMGVPTAGFVYKLVAIGEPGAGQDQTQSPVAKRSPGKASFGGRKWAWRALLEDAPKPERGGRPRLGGTGMGRYRHRYPGLPIAGRTCPASEGRRGRRSGGPTRPHRGKGIPRPGAGRRRPKAAVVARPAYEVGVRSRRTSGRKAERRLEMCEPHPQAKRLKSPPVGPAFGAI